MVATFNVEFGRRLLRRGCGREVALAHFVEVARELVAESPAAVAMHLALLVALDVESGSAAPPAVLPRSPN